ncbi:hypothetical protein [Streptomyces sp. NPDC056453]|uniref:hypothetical protein n=1 Tax=Streptomyces sp. NPDC056453 TaxID=3345822 RepID=UPI0036B36712
MMAGKRKANEAGSSNGLRGDVLCVLGVLKVATADQIQRLTSPNLTYRHTLKKTAALRKEARTASHRGAANDLRRHGLAVDGGRTRGGEEVRLLTKDGLAAAAIDLDREPEEMGGMPKSAGRSGASHPMTVNETVIALIRPKPSAVAQEICPGVASSQPRSPTRVSTVGCEISQADRRVPQGLIRSDRPPHRWTRSGGWSRVCGGDVTPQARDPGRAVAHRGTRPAGVWAAGP